MSDSHHLKASCFCPTFGRPHLLEEAIESFLRQDYPGPKELIILNDYAGHSLHFDHPEIKIYNVSEQIVPLGRKFNELIKLCSGDVLFPWEDDDIYLPWRISHSMAHLHDGLFHTNQAWQDDGVPLLRLENNWFQCNLAVSRQKWLESGGYAELDVSAIDTDLFRRLQIKRASQTLATDKVFYIYRWAGSDSFHGSAQGGYSEGISQAAEEFVRKEAQRGNIASGQVQLQPRWSRNWVQMAELSMYVAGESTGDAALVPNEPVAQVDLMALRPYHEGYIIDQSLAIPVPESKRVVILDPLARALWEALYKGLCPQVVSELVAEAFTISLEDARNDVYGIMRYWRQVNLLSPNRPNRFLQVGHRIIAIENQCAAIQPFLAASVEHLHITPPRHWDCYLQILEEGDSISLLKDGVLILETTAKDSIVERLIAEITEQGYKYEQAIGVLHAAAVNWKGHCIVLPAQSGSGKTTLAAALMHAGADYLADDVVSLLTGEGSICPLRLGLCLKEKSWSLLEELYPDLSELPTLTRHKVAVRYLPPTAVSGDRQSTHTTSAIIFPNYRHGEKSRVTPLSMVDCLQRIIANLSCFDQNESGTQLPDLIHWIESNDAYEVTYDKLESGVRAIGELLDSSSVAPAHSPAFQAQRLVRDSRGARSAR